MRRAILLALLLLVPTALAARTYEHRYVVVGDGCTTVAAVVQSCKPYAVLPDETSISATVTDASGQSVRIRICHEWTYDDGSHRRLTCRDGCSPTFTDALTHPTSPGVYYRVFVDLRGGPAGCAVEASAGTLRVTFS